MNKDLIEDIKDKLKNAEDYPYREGAWERFASQYRPSAGKVRPMHSRWKQVAASLALLLTASAAIYFVLRTEKVPMEGSKVYTSESNASGTSPQREALSELPVVSNNGGRVHTPVSVDREATSTKTRDIAKHVIAWPSDEEEKALEVNSVKVYASLDLQHMKLPSLTAVSKSSLSGTSPKKERPAVYTTLSQESGSLAYAAYEGKGATTLKNKLMRVGNNFQLGLYVSPYKTSDRFDVGAGMLLAYRLTDKIGLRTGASYNAYTVGVMKDPLETSSAEVVESSSLYNKNIVANNGDVQSTMLLPNINAVLGKVEAIEIPLEVTYSFNKNLYVSTGISYSSIINQERQAQYIDNGGVRSLQSSTSKIVSAANEVNKNTVKHVKSLEPNVNPKGYAGFVNFSVGKTVNINNKVSLSLEPYLKVPAGQMRKSDLDYTNTGIRIITSF